MQNFNALNSQCIKPTLCKFFHYRSKIRLNRRCSRPTKAIIMLLFITHCENKCREFYGFLKEQDVLIVEEVLGNKCDFFQSVASTRRNHHFYRTTHNVRNQYCWGPTFVARLRFVPGYALELLELQSNEHSSLLILRHITL